MDSEQDWKRTLSFQAVPSPSPGQGQTYTRHLYGLERSIAASGAFISGGVSLVLPVALTPEEFLDATAQALVSLRK